MGRLRCRTPTPPCRAMAIAMRDSVTVSIALETNGMRTAILLVTRLDVSTSLGTISDSPGSSRTSSNVRPCRATFPALFSLASPLAAESTASGYSHTQGAGDASHSLGEIGGHPHPRRRRALPTGATCQDAGGRTQRRQVTQRRNPRRTGNLRPDEHSGGAGSPDGLKQSVVRDPGAEHLDADAPFGQCSRHGPQWKEVGFFV